MKNGVKKIQLIGMRLKKNDNPDMLITKTGVEMWHRHLYLWECKKEEETND